MMEDWLYMVLVNYIKMLNKSHLIVTENDDSEDLYKEIIYEIRT